MGERIEPQGEGRTVAYVNGDPRNWIAVDTSDPDWLEKARSRLERIRQLNLEMRPA